MSKREGLAAVCCKTALGPFIIAADAESLVWAGFDAQLPPSPDSALCREAARQLSAYFEGRLHAFDLPLAPDGTPFQRAVWQRLTDVPWATTVSYGALATAMGRPTAARAVGAAVGRNPLAIFIPCHRVIGRDGSLTGYAWGVARKRALLTLERGHAGA